MPFNLSKNLMASPIRVWARTTSPWDILPGGGAGCAWSYKDDQTRWVRGSNNGQQKEAAEGGQFKLQPCEVCLTQYPCTLVWMNSFAFHRLTCCGSSSSGDEISTEETTPRRRSSDALAAAGRRRNTRKREACAKHHGCNISSIYLLGYNNLLHKLHDVSLALFLGISWCSFFRLSELCPCLFLLVPVRVRYRVANVQLRVAKQRVSPSKASWVRGVARNQASPNLPSRQKQNPDIFYEWVVSVCGLSLSKKNQSETNCARKKNLSKLDIMM